MANRNPLRQIKASAGSGKTYALTGDFLNLLASAGSEPRCGNRGCGLPPKSGEAYDGGDWPEIMAVTFTNRAAAEMKERVLSRLKDMVLGACALEPGWTEARAACAVETLLRDFDALNMRTIDSLLHLIVRLAALDLELPPDFEPVFEKNEIFAPLLDELAEQARDGVGMGAELADAFREACRQALLYGDFQGFLAGDRVRARIMDLASLLLHDPAAADSLATPDAIAARLAAMCDNVRQLAALLRAELDAQKLNVNHNFQKALEACIDPACPDSALPPSSKMLAKSSLNECLNAASKNKGGPTAEGLFDRLIAAVRQLKTQGAVLRSAQRYMPFVDLARRVIEDLPDFQRRVGMMPASQIPALAEQALGGTYGVNEAFCRMGSRLTHILVDEFQDTSLDQWQALKQLVVEALGHGGSLSIVGDVKQAIYGWRGGEAALFDLVPQDADLRRLAPHPEENSLDCNWRSRRNIVEWNNAVFSQLDDPDLAADILNCLLNGASRNDADDSDEAQTTDGSFQEIDRQAAAMLALAFANSKQDFVPDKTGGLVRLRMLPPPPPRKKRQSRTDDEAEDAGRSPVIAEMLADRVEELGRRLPWGSICVLTRSNMQTSLAAAHLLRRGIPVVTQGSLLLAEQPLIAQTVALLGFLNSPDDDNAFWTVLTGAELLPPLSGLDLDALRDWAVRRAGLRRRGGTLARAFRVTFPAVWKDMFAPLHDTAGLLTPYDTACEIFSRWKVAERHPDAAGFLLRFLEVLHTAEQKGLTDLAGFLDYWQSKGGQEKAPLPETMNAVNIMTVHKAKGLQFEVVITPWLDFNIKPDFNAKAGGPPTLYQDETGLSVLAPLASGMGEPYRQALADAAREAIHLLYVAWTRAVSELHCFIPAPESGHMAAAIHELLATLLAKMAQTPEGEWILGEIPPDMPAADSTLQPGGPASVLPSLSGIDQAAHTQTVETGQHSRTDTMSNIRPDTRPDTIPDVGDAGWRPMAWLPRLKIFRSPLENWTGDWSFSAKRRGTLMHHCLELLRLTGDAASDAAVAVRHGMDTFPLPVPDREQAARDLTATLSWYAALPDAARWLAHGTPEHTLLDENGGAHRVDLLVDDGEEMTAVEYKTGTSGPLPAPAHKAQLGGYLRLLRQATDLPCRGVLVYLDRREIIPLNGEDATGKSHA